MNKNSGNNIDDLNADFEKNTELLREKQKNKELQEQINSEFKYDLLINNYYIFLLKIFKYNNINLAFNMKDSILYLGITLIIASIIFHFIFLFFNI